MLSVLTYKPRKLDQINSLVQRKLRAGRRLEEPHLGLRALGGSEPETEDPFRVHSDGLGEK